MKLKILLIAGLGLVIAVAGTASAATTTNPGVKLELAKQSIACVGQAVRIREQALKTGLNVYLDAIKAAQEKRSNDLSTATLLQRSGSIVKTANKKAWSEYKTATKAATTTWKATQKSTWATYKTEAKKCKAPSGVMDSGRDFNGS